MPEGPEIRRAADRVAKAVSNHPLRSVEFAFEHLEPYQKELQGQTITAVDTYGKAMLTRFEGGLTLYSHNQLYGRWFVRRAGKDPETNRQLRVALRTDTHSALLYSASEIEVLDEEGLESHPFLRNLGIDPLWPSTKPSDVFRFISDPSFSKRQLGGLLLDQGFVAGLGNYLRSEILWHSGLHPSVRPGDLDEASRKKLARNILTLTRRSYRTGGVTNTPAMVKTLESQGEPKRKSRFAVFGRDGLDCLDCGMEIERIEVGSRRLYLCPLCQPERAQS